MVTRLLMVCSVAMICSALLSTFALAAKRVALVIGNADYAIREFDLANPVNDADEMAAKLMSLGFDVVKAVNVTSDQQTDLIVRFAEALDDAEVALLFYSGHGVQIDGRNYIVPVDIDPDSRARFDAQVLDMARVFGYMQSDNRVALSFIDACRDNPFRVLTNKGAKSLASDPGLAAPQLEGTGLFVGFATAPGDVAEDGSGGNSPFTTALLKYLGEPGLEINQVMTRVKADVRVATSGDQRPWTNSDLSTDVVLVPGGRPDSFGLDEQMWGRIEATNDVQAYELFKRLFPESSRIPDANAKLAALGSQRSVAPMPDASDDIASQMGLSFVGSDSGLIVSRVDPKSQAFRCGLRAGTRIDALDGNKITTPESFSLAVNGADGEYVRFSLYDGTVLDCIDVRGVRGRGQTNPELPASTVDLRLGLSFVGTESGLIISQVARQSIAFRCGIRGGMKIVSVNGSRVTTPESFDRVVLGSLTTTRDDSLRIELLYYGTTLVDCHGISDLRG